MATHKTTPRDVYLHLLSMVTLYISVIGFITLLFQYINAIFPDVLEPYRFYGDTFAPMRNAIASLIVAWPIYIWISRIIGKDFSSNPEHREVKIRKWLLYLTLFIAAIAIVVDLIQLINGFLSGELVASFALKALSVLVIAGLVFWYYSWDLKRDAKSNSERPRIIGIAASVVILASIIGSFFVMGSPNEQRARRFDQERIRDLQSIQHQIFNFYRAKEVLPENLDDLKQDTTGFVAPIDPATNSPYEYEVVEDTRFTLCAVFETEHNPHKGLQVKPISPLQANNLWEHGAGRVCFSREVDKEFLKSSLTPFPEPIITPY